MSKTNNYPNSFIFTIVINVLNKQGTSEFIYEMHLVITAGPYEFNQEIFIELL